jgi:hypothetical protein
MGAAMSLRLRPRYWFGFHLSPFFVGATIGRGQAGEIAFAVLAIFWIAYVWQQVFG